jgi:hypothetical protein
VEVAANLAAILRRPGGGEPTVGWRLAACCRGRLWTIMLAVPSTVLIVDDNALSSLLSQPA